MNKCYCDSQLTFEDCCAPILKGKHPATDAKALMRSRYTAFAVGNADYLLASWHPDFRPKTLELDTNQQWIGLKVQNHHSTGDHAEVTFTARYKINGKAFRMEEHSVFSLVGGRWYYCHPK